MAAKANVLGIPSLHQIPDDAHGQPKERHQCRGSDGDGLLVGVTADHDAQRGDEDRVHRQQVPGTALTEVVVVLPESEVRSVLLEKDLKASRAEVRALAAGHAKWDEMY